MQHRGPANQPTTTYKRGGEGRDRNETTMPSRMMQKNDLCLYFFVTILYVDGLNKDSSFIKIGVPDINHN